jgi:hypothetical protein
MRSMHFNDNIIINGKQNLHHKIIEPIYLILFIPSSILRYQSKSF